MFKKNGFLSAMLISYLFFFISCQKETPLNPDPLIIEEDQPVTDYDGHVYQTMKIGNQIWMAENLKSTHYSDGTLIENFSYNNDTTNAQKYGRLYRWAAAMRNAASSNSNPSKVQGASPAGWHIPSDAEWQQLINSLGGSTVAGGKLKATGTDHWLSPNTGATNESKFNALPAGFYRVDGIFMTMGERTIFLTTNMSSPIMVRTLRNNSAKILAEQFHPQDAVSIRCIKD